MKYLKKNIPTYFIALAILVALFFPLLVPQPVRAQTTVICANCSTEVNAILQLAKEIGIYSQSILTQINTAGIWAQQLLEWAKKIATEYLRRKLLNMIVDQIVTWIQGGGNPKFITDWPGFFRDAIDQAGGQFLKEIGLSRICSAFKAQLSAGFIPIPKFDTRSACTFSQAGGNLNNFLNDFRTGGWVAWQEMTLKPENNIYGTYLMAWDEYEAAQVVAAKAAESEAQAGRGFISVRKCLEPIAPADGGGCAKSEIITPGATVGDLVSKAVGSDIDYIVNAQDLAAYVAAIANAILNRLFAEGVGLLHAGLSTSPPPPSRIVQCNDGIDNDGDGKIDFPADPDCLFATDTNEASGAVPKPQCSDGIDNDGDGLIDFPADPECISPNAPSESITPAPQCSDGIDNDGDGLIDFPADPGCVNIFDRDETDTLPPPPTGQINWNSWDVITQSGAPQATVTSVSGGVTTNIEFYESTNNFGVAKGPLLSNFTIGAHPDGFNNLQLFWWSANGEGKPYPYAGKSTINRGSDVNETNAQAPLGVKDLQLHPPQNDHNTVAAFKIPQGGTYTVTNLGVRKVSNASNPRSGTTARLRVLNPQGTQITMLTASNNQAWVTSANSLSLPNLSAGQYIYFGVDRDGDFGWDATEVSWTISIGNTPPPSPTSFTPVSSTQESGFFSLANYNNKLFAGSYGTPKSYTWDDSNWVDVSGTIGTAGESVFDMQKFSVDGNLYAATEGFTGLIFRFNNSTNKWETAFNTGGTNTNCFSAAEYRGYLFVGCSPYPNTRMAIYRTADGINWTLAWTTDIPKGGFVVYGGYLYLLGFIGSSGVALRTNDPLATNWPVAFTKPGRLFGERTGYVWNNKLYIGSTELPWSNTPGKGSILIWDGTNLQEAFKPAASEGVQFFSAFKEFGNTLYTLSFAGWRVSTGNAKLYSTADGVTWKYEYTFPEPEGWDLEVYKNHLYAATRKDAAAGGGGKVYKSESTPPNPAPIGFHVPTDCTASYGWTCDASDYSVPLTVHFYADGPAGSGTLFGVTTANIPAEPAVAAACGGFANHRFQFPTPNSLKTGTNRSIYAYAIDYPSANQNPLLTSSSSPQIINCQVVQPPPNSFTPVGTTPDPGFFSLEEFNGKLFAGTYGRPRSYEWDGTTFTEHTGGQLRTAGESLFDMVKFSADGKLYGTTENSGKVFRFNPAINGWELVYQAPSGGWNNAYSIVEYKGSLFTGFNNFPDSTKTLVVRYDGSNWTTRQIDGFNTPRFGVFNNDLYMVGMESGRNRAQARKISDPSDTSWPVAFTMPGIFTGHPYVFKGELYVGMENAPRRAGTLYRWNGTRAEAVFTPSDNQAAIVFELKEFQNALYLLSGVEWRASSGNAQLYKSPDGINWTKVTQFAEPEGWALQTYNGDLYVGTRKNSGGGKVYKSQL